MKSGKKSVKKKQSTNKTKWDCQNPRVVSCGHDNTIEEKTYVYKKF
jgi:hypothetical protein